jgi:hypothetical protein
MPDTITNRGKFLALNGGWAALDLRMAVLLDTNGTDVSGLTAATIQDFNTVADIDGVGTISIHSELIALAGESYAEDDTNNWALADANTVSFAAAPGVTAEGVCIYDEGGGTPATREVIAVYTTGFPQPMDGGLDVNIPNGFARGT